MKSIDVVISALCHCQYSNCKGCPYLGTKGMSCKEAMMNDAGDWLAQFSKERNMGMQGSKSGWISVEDRLPETDDVMAIRCVTKKGVVSWNRAWYDGQFWHGSGSFAGVTHWMPISTEVGK